MAFPDASLNAQLWDLAERVAQDNFLELFELKTHPQGGKLVLTVALDKKSGPVTLDDCTAVSRDLEKKLDELDLIKTSYLLEVSSPGLDRPLRNLEDCLRFQGSMAQFTLAEPLEGLVSFQGRLLGTDGARVQVQVGKERTVWVPYALVKAARLVVE
ncbi:MAG TPA: ribosome maturation factor RimP [bacterium]|nr:ribosome maturation factor RimP [bacterium]